MVQIDGMYFASSNCGLRSAFLMVIVRAVSWEMGHVMKKLVYICLALAGEEVETMA